MATKSGIISTINGYIAAVVNIANHRLSMLEVVNELWQTTYNITDFSGSNKFYYNLNFKKQGNIVFVDGSIINKFTVSKGFNTEMVTIPNSVFFALSSLSTPTIQPTKTSNIPILFINNKIKLYGTLAPNQEIIINCQYQTND